MREKDVRDPVVAYAKRQKLLHIRQHFGKGASAGWPDDLILFERGVVAFIEFKRPGGKPTKLQERRLLSLRQRGHIAFVCDNVEYGKRRIDEIIAQTTAS